MAEKKQPKNLGRPPFKPTDDERKMVSQMAAVGIPHEQIAAVTRGGIDADTLKKHFKDELRESRIKANAKIGGSLYNRAINGDTTAAIFWAKTQMGWSEKQHIEHSGEIKQITVEYVSPKHPDS
jgi:hypothetical protein